jgi:hypothetical protein
METMVGVSFMNFSDFAVVDVTLCRLHSITNQLSELATAWKARAFMSVLMVACVAYGIVLQGDGDVG